VLFDEIEKAHPDVFHVLLQILDDGRLTDSQGRTVDFRNVVVLMTSNIGSQYILEATQAGQWADVEKVVRGQLSSHFRPEFLNRVDDVVVFRPLGEAELRKIVDLQLRRVVKLAADVGLVLEVTDAAKALLAQEGFDPVYGARPLKRAIQRQVQDPLAIHLLDEEVAEGTIITVDVAAGGEHLTFASRPGAGLAAESVNVGLPRA
jgi:ATP-dependent Clp protease ATP-binding subunit ClpB